MEHLSRQGGENYFSRSLPPSERQPERFILAGLGRAGFRGDRGASREGTIRTFLEQNKLMIISRLMSNCCQMHQFHFYGNNLAQRLNETIEKTSIMN